MNGCNIVEHEIVTEPNGTKHCLNCDYEEVI